MFPLLNQHAGVISVPYYGHFDLDEVLFFLSERDYSLFDFYSDYSDEEAVIFTKETGELHICNVPEDSIPEETVRLVIDALEHWDECLEQAYDWLRFWDFENGEWNPKQECLIDRGKREFDVSETFFGLENWPGCDYKEYCLKQKKGTEVFSIEFEAGDYPLGFNLKFRCKDRRLYKIVVHII